MHRRHCARSLVLCAVSALLVLIAGPPIASAAIPSDTTTIGVTARLCTDAACESYNDALIGFEISVVNQADGQVLDTCVTANDNQIQGCGLEFPAGIDWTLWWDSAQTPAGYVPYAGILHPLDGPGPHPYIVAFVPTNASQPTVAPITPPVTELPSTGSGPHSASWTLPIMALSATTLIAARFSLRPARR